MRRPPTITRNSDNWTKLPDGYAERTNPGLDDHLAYEMEGSPAWQRYVYEIAAGIASTIDHRTFIDIGCGFGHRTMEAVDMFSPSLVVGIDLAENINEAEARYPDEDEDGTSIVWLPMNLENVPSQAGDGQTMVPGVPDIGDDCLVVCADVLEHLLDPRPLVRWLSQGAARGATVVISTPDRDRIYADNAPARKGPPNNPNHVREWTLDELCAMLESFGLTVRFRGHVLSSDARRAKLTTSIVVCRRPAWSTPSEGN